MTDPEGEIRPPVIRNALADALDQAMLKVQTLQDMQWREGIHVLSFFPVPGPLGGTPRFFMPVIPMTATTAAARPMRPRTRPPGRRVISLVMCMRLSLKLVVPAA
jgi:hypothetical protein